MTMKTIYNDNDNYDDNHDSDSNTDKYNDNSINDHNINYYITISTLLHQYHTNTPNDGTNHATLPHL